MLGRIELSSSTATPMIRGGGLTPRLVTQLLGVLCALDFTKK